MKMDNNRLSSSTADLVLSQPFIDSIQNGLIVSDLDLCLVSVNKWVAQALDLNPAELTAKPLGEIFPELAKRNLMEAYRLVLQTHMPLTLSHRIHRYFIKMPPVTSYAKTFLEMPQSVIISPLFEDDLLVGTLTTIFDVTERVMTERALQNEIHKLNVLDTIARALATLDIDQCLQTIVQNSLEVFHAETAALFLYERGALQIACQRPEQQPFEIDQALFTSISTSLKPASILTPYNPTSPLSLGGSMRAELAAPLVVEGRCIGILSVQAFLQFGFSTEERNLLEILATRAAIAIHNARLHRKEKAPRQLLETLKDISVALTSELNPDAILDSLLESMEDMLPFDTARIIFVDRQYFHVARHRGYELFGRPDFWDTRTLSIQDFPYLGEMASSHLPMVIADTQLEPAWNAVEALAHVRSSAGAPIFVRGQLTGFLLVEKVNPGFYTEDHVNILAAFSTQAGIAIENARLYEQQKKLAVIDGLTGISNRRFLDEAITREIERGRAMGHNTSLMIMDIDFFKRFNDTYGHLGGDSVLKNLAALLQQNIRPVDTVGRYGGEEFIVVMPETDLAGAQTAAERLRQKIERMHQQWSPLPNTELPPQQITVSVGVSCAPHYANNTHDLIETADQSMYRAKQSGRNRVIICNDAT